MSSSTSTSLTLRALLKTAANRLGLGVPGKGVSGLTPAAKALFAAAATARDRVVVVVPTDAEVEQLTSDARFFLSALEGVSDADAANLVVPFPSHEIDPYRGLSPHFDIASARARALHALSTGAARLVIASAAALLPQAHGACPVQGDGFLAALGRRDVSPIDLGDRLAEAGYTRQDPTDEPGEFSVRGGRGGFLRRRRAAADPPGVRRRHHRVAAHLRSGYSAIDRSRSIRRTSSRCRNCC